MDDFLHSQKILILDYGSQYTQLIARRVREAGTYCEIHPWHMEAEAVHAFAPQGIILSGGHHSVYDPGAPVMNEAALALGVPILGICYGMHLLARHFGGDVSASQAREYGRATIHLAGKKSGFAGGFLSSGEGTVWMSHGDHVTRVPFGFHPLAQSDNGILAAMAHEELAILGVQFHPEVNHTVDGEKFIQGFIQDVCGCRGLWTAGNVIEHEILLARQKVGGDQVILGLSGGVDSAVTAVLLQRAIGDQLTCVFVDNGLLRLNEGEEVMATFASHLGVKVIRVDAEERFLSRLVGVTDPEQKRKIIGHTFIEVFEEEANKIEGVKWLAQGTIYPDVIESAGSKTNTATNIKSHHNVGGLPERMGLKLLEPLRELFKDEVRTVGLELGLPARMIFRHPFPGPGLGVRILGEVKKEFADLLRRA
ncbi:MAG: glutamine-hydrolyzing GMP synthase, partial [Magnetococcales bacterium]|nr:glutamine-hydrolyzing GMP synthase [Magnetococcales bacterium]